MDREPKEAGDSRKETFFSTITRNDRVRLGAACRLRNEDPDSHNYRLNVNPREASHLDSPAGRETYLSGAM